MNIQKPILAIDYGQRRIGLAISDSKGIIASPLDVLEVTNKKTVENIINEILQIVEEYRVKTILIGLPQVFIEKHEESNRKIEKFKNILSKRTSLPIIFQDESYSTTEAQNMLLSLGQRTKSTRHKIDKISATVFLQEFLNSESKTNENDN